MMDSSRNMFDFLKDKLWDQLGQLDPDWFNVLTVKASHEESNPAREHRLRTAHHDDGFKTPYDRGAAESQLFSTPKMFRHGRSLLSPHTQLDESFHEHGKERPPGAGPGSALLDSSAEHTPVTKLFQSSPHHNHFELLDTPQRASNMMESLGAQVNPDLSWTSSLNTPPPVPSTLILTKPEDIPTLVSSSEDRNIIFVRKLFPSLSDVSGVNVISPTKNSKADALHNLRSAVGGGGAASQEGTSSDSQHSSLEPSDQRWKQTLPDAIHDQELREAVAGVLDGAENVLSMFFTNSSSALRRVKTKERLQRRQTERVRNARKASMERPAETAGEGRDLAPSPPRQRGRSGGAGVTQWTPFSLTEISEAALKMSPPEDHPGKKPEATYGHAPGTPESRSGPAEVIRPSLTTAGSLFGKRKRRFVYHVQSPQPEEKDDVKQTLKAQQAHLLSDGAPCVKQREQMTAVRPSLQDSLMGPGPVASAAGTTQDLDMSQLCRALDQDFTPMTEVVTKPQDLLSPSTDLLLVKEPNRERVTRLEEAEALTACPLTTLEPTAGQRSSYLPPDSGILSRTTDRTKPAGTSSPIPSIVHEPFSHGAHSTEHTLVPFSPLSEEKERILFEDIEEGPSVVDRSAQTHSISGIELMTEESMGPAGEDVKHTTGHTSMGFYFPMSGSSGFKTASNKGIQISPVNLQRARDIFKEVEEQSIATFHLNRHEDTASVKQNNVPVSAIPPTQASAPVSAQASIPASVQASAPASVQASIPASVLVLTGGRSVDDQHRLTESQKADVTELCNLLEETHTQFDFTQFKPAQPNMTPEEARLSPKATDAELDPEFLAGIDFDDSFSCDAETHLKENVQSPPGRSSHMVSTMNNESHASVADPLKKKEASSITHISNAPKPKDTLKAVSKHESNISRDTETLGHQQKHPFECHLGFQTAGGKSFSVSKKCLNKAKALFSDLEDIFLPFIDSSDSSCRGSVNGGTASCHQQIPHHNTPKDASALGTSTNLHPGFTDSHVTVINCVTVNNHDKVHSTVPESPLCQGILSETPAPECENKALCQTPGGRLKGGFSMASGRGIRISAQAIRAASRVFNNIDAVEPATPPPHQKCGDVEGNVKGNEEEPASNLTRDTLTEREQYGETSSASVAPSATRSDDDRTHDGGFKKPTVKDVLPVPRRAPPQEESAALSSGWATPVVGARGHSGFSTASGKKVSVSGEALAKAKTLLRECDCGEDEKPNGDGSTARPLPGTSPKVDRLTPVAIATSTSSSENAGRRVLMVGSGGAKGFSTAGGTVLSVSDKALARARALLGEDYTHQEKEQAAPTANHPGPSPIPIPTVLRGGFQTASGKGVAISAAALLKAKATVSDCDILVEAPVESSGPTKAPPPGPSGGFLAASGKPVRVSSEALQKAKSLFDDFSCDTEIFGRSQAMMTEEKSKEGPNNVEGMRFGFTTAKGTAVLVSEDNLLKARNLLNKEERGASGVGSHSEESFKNHQYDQEMVDVTTTLLNSDQMRTQQRYEPVDKMTPRQDAETSAPVSRLTPAGESAAVRSEMMAVQSDGPVHRVVEMHKATGKRSIEDADGTDQPPLKRRLLEEFDHAVDGDRASSLLPAKSSPHGVLRDRRLFQSRVCMDPHITGPLRDGRSYVAPPHQKPRPDPGSAPPAPPHPRAPVFVPPFLKSRRADPAQTAADPQGPTRARTPAPFTPPFKRPPQPHPPTPPPPPSPPDTSLYVPPAAIATKNPATVPGSPGGGGGGSGLHGDQINTVPGECASVAGDPTAGNHELEQDLGDPEDLQDLRLARDLQDLRLQKKKRQAVRPLPGGLLLAKTSGVARVPLRTAVWGLPPGRHSPQQLYQHGVHLPVWAVTAGNAEAFRLPFLRFFRAGALGERGGVQLADGGRLVPRDDWTVGKEEFYRALCDSPGVDLKLLSPEWAYNHYRWVVWKLASMERAFPATMATRWLTPEQILLQLKYRYDVEVDLSRRPALRRITERDDTAAKTLVLCVCGVDPPGPRTPGPGAVWLTDGWYALRAQLDPPLTALLRAGRLAPGGKLVVSGAELVGGEEACSPLDAPPGLMLKVGANSSRRACWDAKLGFHRDPRPLLLPLSSLYAAGGPVGCVDLLVLRSYPVLWMEKKQDGGYVFRSERAEEREVRRFEDLKRRTMETLYAKIQSDLQREDAGKDPAGGRRSRRTVRRQELEKLRDGEELHEAVESDPADLEACLSAEQLAVLLSYRRSLLEKRQASLQERCRRALDQALQDPGPQGVQEGRGGWPRRDVAPVWKLCVVDGRAGGPVHMLNVWRPPADLQARLKEGERYRVHHLSVSASKKARPGAALQLTATSRTHLQEVQVGRDRLSDHFQPRRSVHFRELQDPGLQSPCGEVDLVGYVVSTADTHGSSPVLYLADGGLNLVKVRCFSPLVQAGLEELVKPAALLALSNLQLNVQRAAPALPVLYAGDLTSFSSNPREPHLHSALDQLRAQTRAVDGFLQRAQESLSRQTQGEDPALVPSPWSDRTRTPAGPPGRPGPAVCVTPRQQTSSTPQTSLPPPPTSDPKSLRRRRALDFLSRMPSPPPLGPHLGSLASPAAVKNTFQPPRRSTTPTAAVTARHAVAMATATPARQMTKEQEDEWGNDEGLMDTQALRGERPADQ